MSSQEILNVAQCFTSLNTIASNHPDECVKMMASELHKALITITGKNTNRIDNEGKSGMENANGRHNRNFKDDSKDFSEFEKAWHDLSDPLLPVRGHAILALSKLILARDPETIANKHKLLAIFQVRVLQHLL